MTRPARLIALTVGAIGLMVANAASAESQPVDGLAKDIYEQAVGGITPEMMTNCERLALEAIAAEMRTGAGVEWLSKMAPGEIGRRISGSWADRVGRTEDSVAALDKSYLVAITGEVRLTPKQPPTFKAIPVCWFDYEAGGAPVLRTATLRR